MANPDVPQGALPAINPAPGYVFLPDHAALLWVELPFMTIYK